MSNPLEDRKLIIDIVFSPNNKNQRVYNILVRSYGDFQRIFVRFMGDDLPTLTAQLADWLNNNI